MRKEREPAAPKVLEGRAVWLGQEMGVRGEMRPERSAGTSTGRACAHASIWHIVRGVRERFKNGSDMQLRTPEPLLCRGWTGGGRMEVGTSMDSGAGRWRGDRLRAIRRQGPELGPDSCFLPTSCTHQSLSG